MKKFLEFVHWNVMHGRFICVILTDVLVLSVSLTIGQKEICRNKLSSLLSSVSSASSCPYSSLKSFAHPAFRAISVVLWHNTEHCSPKRMLLFVQGIKLGCQV